MTKISEELKKLRKESGLTHEEIGSKMSPKMKRSTYAAKEKSGKFTDDELTQISQILDVSTEHLMSLERPFKQAIGVDYRDDLILALKRENEFLRERFTEISKKLEGIVNSREFANYLQTNTALVKTLFQLLPEYYSVVSGQSLEEAQKRANTLFVAHYKALTETDTQLV